MGSDHKDTAKIKAESLKSTRLLYQKRVTERSKNSYIVENDGIAESWAKIKSNILDSAKDALGEIKINRFQGEKLHGSEQKYRKRRNLT